MKDVWLINSKYHQSLKTGIFDLQPPLQKKNIEGEIYFNMKPLVKKTTNPNSGLVNLPVKQKNHEPFLLTAEIFQK